MSKSNNPQTLLFEAQPGAGHSGPVSPSAKSGTPPIRLPDGLDSRTPAPGDYPAPNSIAGRVLAAIPTGTHGVTFGTLVKWLPGIYWAQVSAALLRLVAAGLVEEIRSNKATCAGVSYPRFTVRYRINAHG